MSNRHVAEKYNVPRNTALTRVKIKGKLLASLEKKCTNSKRQKLRSGVSKRQIKQFTDTAVYTWLIISKQSQQIPTDGVILKEKALEFAKALGKTGFKASDCWLSNCKEM